MVYIFIKMHLAFNVPIITLIMAYIPIKMCLAYNDILVSLKCKPKVIIFLNNEKNISLHSMKMLRIINKLVHNPHCLSNIRSCGFALSYL